MDATSLILISVLIVIVIPLISIFIYKYGISQGRLQSQKNIIEKDKEIIEKENKYQKQIDDLTHKFEKEKTELKYECDKSITENKAELEKKYKEKYEDFIKDAPEKIKGATVDKIMEEKKKEVAQILGHDFQKDVVDLAKSIFGNANIKSITDTDLTVMYRGLKIVLECKNVEKLTKTYFDQANKYIRELRANMAWIIIPEFREGKSRKGYPKVSVFKMKEFIVMSALIKEAHLDFETAKRVIREISKFEGDIGQLIEKLYNSKKNITKGLKGVEEATSIAEDVHKRTEKVKEAPEEPKVAEAIVTVKNSRKGRKKSR